MGDFFRQAYLEDSEKFLKEIQKETQEEVSFVWLKRLGQIFPLTKRKKK